MNEDENFCATKRTKCTIKDVHMTWALYWKSSSHMCHVYDVFGQFWSLKMCRKYNMSKIASTIPLRASRFSNSTCISEHEDLASHLISLPMTKSYGFWSRPKNDGLHYWLLSLHRYLSSTRKIQPFGHPRNMKTCRTSQMLFCYIPVPQSRVGNESNRLTKTYKEEINKTWRNHSKIWQPIWFHYKSSGLRMLVSGANRCSAGSVKIVDKAELTRESALAKTWLFLHPLTFRTILNFPTVQALCFTRHWAAEFNVGITLPSEVRRKYIKSNAMKGKSASSQLGVRELKQTH